MEYYSHPPELKSSRLFQEVHALDYPKRRQFLWHRVSPRPERFTYRYFPLIPDEDISIDRLKDVISRSRFWLASPRDFNDPFDCKVHVIEEKSLYNKSKKVDELLSRFLGSIGPSDRTREFNKLMARSNAEWHQIAERAIHDEIESIGVTCFSDDPRNLLMWSHYARNHTGVCFQFEVAKDPNTFVRALSTNYTKSYPTINFFNYTPDEITNILYTKFNAWEYEKERRFVAPRGVHKWLAFEPDALVGIILGTKISAQGRELVVKMINERAKMGFPMLRIYEARQHPSSFRIFLHQI